MGIRAAKGWGHRGNTALGSLQICGGEQEQQPPRDLQSLHYSWLTFDTGWEDPARTTAAALRTSTNEAEEPVCSREARTYVCTKSWTQMFKAALFIMVKANEVSPTDKWINKMQYIHIMEYYPTVERKEILTYATWINLKDIK